jgi:antitoxin component YwqK of YwqJK toxin-antitoxin module
MQYTLVRLFYFLAIVSTVAFTSVAQPVSKKHDPVKVTFYYNAIWELTTPANSAYRREAYFDLTDMVFDGVFSDYNRKDELIADGNYDHGVKSGIQSEYVNHTVKLKIEYSGHNFTIWEWNDGKGEGVKNGNGKFNITIFYFVTVDGQYLPRQGLLQGEFKNGRRAGRWSYYDINRRKADEEQYINGQFQKRVHYTESDSIETKEMRSIYLSLNAFNTEALAYDKGSFSNLNQYFREHVPCPPTLNRNVTYPGGARFLLKLLANTMAVPEKNMEVIRLRVDANGKIEKATIIRSINSTYDILTDRFLDLHENRFLPAVINGQPVTGVIFLPVASGEEWMQTLDEAPIEWLLDYTNFMN